MSDDAVVSVRPLGMPPWETFDPFLFCVHHNDSYPKGNEKLGPVASLAGLNIGQDFEGIDGWRMYHGDVVPGFPSHPHRGFETITIMRRGYVDHSDSLGATARFGPGDIQWMTAGKGIVHCEMFPLLNRDAPNPLELFQIWLNLPSKDKLVEPHFSMLWNHIVPRHTVKDAAGKTTEVVIAAGQLAGMKAPPPPPKSWAAHADSDVAIWTIKMEPETRWTLPRAAAGTNRALYFFKGSSLKVGGRSVPGGNRVALRPEMDVELINGPAEADILLLQGRPIGERVAQYGPFVMNSPAEIQQAFVDYQRTEFGGWPWKGHDPVHPRDQGRFAKHADGHVEKVD
jgi:redox-sensitive bicupin YhaK (pirin superfamily)